MDNKPIRIPGIDSDPDVRCPACGDEGNHPGLCFSCRAAIGRGLDQRESRTVESIEYRLREHAVRLKGGSQ